MQRRSCLWASVFTAIAGAGLLLMLGDRLSAQTAPPQAPRSEIPLVVVPPKADESMPKLFNGPNGMVLRLWQRSAESNAKGGAVFVAAAEPKDSWKTLLDLQPTEEGVSARDAELAVGPSGQLAVLYRWWQERPRSKQIRLARSDDGGKSWSRPAASIDSSGKAFYPRVGWGGGKNLTVVWDDERRGRRSFDVYARHSPDGGVTWDPEQVLSRFPQGGPGDLNMRPEMISDAQDRFWAVWVGIRRGRDKLYLNRSTDGGKTWTDPVPLSGDSQSVFRQSLVRSDDHLLLVWQDVRTGRNRLFAVSSADAGVTWTSPVRIDHVPDDAVTDTTAPSVLLDKTGEALVAWQDGRNGRDDVFLARSTDWGQSWGPEDQRMDMDEAGTSFSRYPKLSKAPDGRVVLAWEDDRTGLEEIYLRVRPAMTRPEWGPEIRVTTPTPKLAHRIPQLAWGPDGLLYLAWETWDHTLQPARIIKSVGGTTLRPGAR